MSDVQLDQATTLWVAGDHSGGLALAFKQQRGTIYTIARSIVGAEGAADVAQDVMLRVWRNPEAFDPDRADLGRYLRVLTRGMAIDRLRANVSRRRREDTSIRTDRAPRSDEFDSIVNDESAHRVHQALLAIPAFERDAIISAFFHRRTYVATAAHLGVPEGTIKSRIRLGLIHLRAELRDIL